MTAPAVVVYINDPSQPQTVTPPRVASAGEFSGPASGVPALRMPADALDPHDLHRRFPEMWARYLIEAFAGSQRRLRIAMHFNVDESTVRAWESGRGGCHGRHVISAIQFAPDVAQRTLLLPLSEAA